jgi:hypothetical protein
LKIAIVIQCQRNDGIEVLQKKNRHRNQHGGDPKFFLSHGYDGERDQAFFVVQRF